MKDTIEIPRPKAAYGEVVQVLNYRCRPAQWEEGVVWSLEYRAIHGPGFSWSYTVYTTRRAGGAFNPIRLSVGDDGIRPLEADDLRRAS